MPTHANTGTPTFQWSKADAIGVEAIDREHQRLFALAEQLHQAMLSGKGKAFLASQIESLIRTVHEHFLHEERLMEQTSYPELFDHRSHHDQIRIKLRAIGDRWAAGECTLTIESMQLFMESLAGQVKDVDLRLGEYLAARGLTGDAMPRAMRGEPR